MSSTTTPPSADRSSGCWTQPASASSHTIRHRRFSKRARGLSAGCVLLDIQMPGVDGLAVQARLNRLGVPLPVIVMTAHGDVARAVQAMKAGAVDFLEKPFDDETLLNGIEAALAKAGNASATASLWRRRSASRPLVRASGKFSMVWWRDARTR